MEIYLMMKIMRKVVIKNNKNVNINKKMSYATMAQLSGTCKPEKHRSDFDKKQLEFFSECKKCNRKPVKENFEGDYNDMYKVLAGFSKENEETQENNETQETQENDDNIEIY